MQSMRVCLTVKRTSHLLHKGGSLPSVVCERHVSYSQFLICIYMITHPHSDYLSMGCATTEFATNSRIPFQFACPLVSHDACNLTSMICSQYVLWISNIACFFANLSSHHFTWNTSKIRNSTKVDVNMAIAS